MSSEASMTSVAPSRAFTSAEARMCESGNERPTFVAGEQNWQPRPQPRVISTTPKVERCRTTGISSTLGGVQRHQVLAAELGVNVRGVGDAERVVRVDGEDFRFGADEAFEVFVVAG